MNLLKYAKKVSKYEERIKLCRKNIRKFTQRLKKLGPGSPHGLPVANELDKWKQAMQSLQKLITLFRGCPIPDCVIHHDSEMFRPVIEEEMTDGRSVNICSEMNTELVNQASEEMEPDDNEGFQLVSPRKAVNIPRMETDAPPTENGNKYQFLAQEKEKTAEKTYPATINLKPPPKNTT
ncbi:hypothetical protein AVEN_136437-1 [Araneus ventricosus]|uniref:Uncharacterized protein n=1 Tax=Araneus ventricosus TaxID=182803 RepID=A0A4Y2JJ88_ARAVE|nr:hypothetical protein AVEN_136437-1 [Araneus ventricosus]